MRAYRSRCFPSSSPGVVVNVVRPPIVVGPDFPARRQCCYSHCGAYRQLPMRRSRVMVHVVRTASVIALHLPPFRQRSRVLLPCHTWHCGGGCCVCCCGDGGVAAAVGTRLARLSFWTSAGQPIPNAIKLRVVQRPLCCISLR